jgi:hypothetical protein
MYVEYDIIFQNGILCSKKAVYLLQRTTTTGVSFFIAVAAAASAEI